MRLKAVKNNLFGGKRMIRCCLKIQNCTNMNFRNSKISGLIGLSLLLAGKMSGQVLTLDQTLAAALQNHPQMRAEALQIQSKQAAEKSARGLSNPEINAESPTGEFYTLGVLQSFEFPTVYKNRKKLAKAETELANIGQKMTENELRLAVRNLYLDLQVADYQLNLERRRDSIFQKISESAARQFAAGEIDFLQKTLAENEAGMIRQGYLAAQKTAQNLRIQLKTWTKMENIGSLEPLQVKTIPVGASAENPALLYEKQLSTISTRQIDLVKSSNLPNFSLGYLNQGIRQTPIDYRFRASVGVPIWFGQNRAARQSAEFAAMAAENQANATAQNIELERSALQNEAEIARSQVDYFEREALFRSQSMIESAMRLRAAGQLDYPTFLRTLDTAFSIENEYLITLKTLNNLQNRLGYLTGQ